jgi:predicted lipoprotein
MARKNSRLAIAQWWPQLAAGTILAALFWRLPLFHVVRLDLQPVTKEAELPALAEKFWTEQLPAAPTVDAGLVAAALRQNAAAAIKKFSRPVGLGGTAYFFLRGNGRVIARTRDTIQLALDGPANAPVVELRTGAVFGNLVRDATGLLDVNQFSSGQDFNGLAAELNHLVEARVLPALRERASVGMEVSFIGCAEAREGLVGEPLLSIVPIQADVSR